MKTRRGLVEDKNRKKIFRRIKKAFTRKNEAIWNQSTKVYESLYKN